MAEKNPSTSSADSGAIRCSFCPCGHVCLRWRRALALHFDQGEVSCALNCLREVLQSQTSGVSQEAGSFSACRATDGFYYLLCQNNVMLRLSEEEAVSLQSELATARAELDRGTNPQLRVM